jgi:DNA-methyltransferase (dcm)
LIGIDLFAGAGGMSLGAQWAGIQIKLAVENNPYAAATYAHNHPGVSLFNKDIRKLKQIAIERGRDQVIVLGGPPCKGFSTSNQRTRNQNNPNNHLFKEFIRVVKLIRPDWVVFENVKGILETEGGFFVDKIQNSLKRLGYTLSVGLLNASNFGVPQNRSRFFIIGSLHGLRIEMPIPNVSRYLTVEEAIIDLPLLENGASFVRLPYRTIPSSNYAAVLRSTLIESPNHLVTRNAPHIIKRFQYVPQGGNWEHIPQSLMKNYKNSSKCHTGIYYRLRSDEPSKVIGNYRKNMLIHPYQDRGLSVREAARLQSFPDNFEFKGSIGFQQEQVGNAVPPLLAKAVFRLIINSAD